MTRCSLTMECIFTLWHSTGSKLNPQSSTWRRICCSFIVTRMLPVDSTPVHLQTTSWKPGKCFKLWTTRKNRRVTMLGKLFRWLQSVVAFMKIKPRFGQKLHIILLTYWISTLWRCICWTSSLAIFAGLANSQIQALSSWNARWSILNKHTDNWNVIRPPSRFCQCKPKRRCFSIESWIQIL